MSIREYIKYKVNDQIYGSLWKNKSWTQQYIKSFKEGDNDKPHGSLFGGSVDDTNNEGEVINMNNASTDSNNGSVDLQTEIGFTIKDNFLQHNTKSMLFGRHITAYYAKIIVEVVKYYDSQNLKGNTELKQKIIKYVHKVIQEHPNLTFTDLLKAFNAQSVECLLAYLLIAYQTNKLDLILRTTYTYGRVLPLKCKTEWFDNYRLNAYGNVLNMVMYHKYDKPGIFTINDDAKPINQSVKLSFYPKVIKFLVGSLRAFIISSNLLPEQMGQNISGGNNASITNDSTNDNTNDAHIVSGGVNIGQTDRDDHDMNDFDFNEIIDMEANSVNNDTLPEFVNNDTLTSYNTDELSGFSGLEDSAPDDKTVMDLLHGASKNLDDEKVCDICYQHYPFFYGGSHGCDVFDMDNMSLSIEEITQFLERYPSARVGYILNTATYRSGRGQHWVALELTHKKAKLVCSQQSNFSCFDDGGKLHSTLQRLGYGLEYNNKSIQRDDYACGTYAFISLMELLRFGDIQKAVENIGVNMSNLGKEIGKESSADKVRQTLVGWFK